MFIRFAILGALADAILLIHAEPGSATEDLCRLALSWDKPTFALDDEANAHLFALGAKPAKPSRIPRSWHPG